MFTLCAASILATTNGDISKIKEDQAYYKQMISMGNITDAKVTDMFAKYDKYYITYEIDIPHSSFKLEGYTYSVYTREQAAHLLYDVRTIQVAVNCPVDEISLRTDSIPIDYYDMPLEQDGEYVLNVRIRTGSIIALSMFGAGIVACIVCHVVIVKKEKKQEISFSKVFDKPTEKRCAYCGSTMKVDETICSACGSRMQK